MMKRTILRKIFILYITLLTFLPTMVHAETGTDVFGADISAPNYCLMEVTTGRVLAERGMDDVVFPASTTKLVTAMVAYDHLAADLPITYVAEALEVGEGSSLSGFMPGDSFSRADIIRGLMIPSGNDIGRLIAITVARRETGNRSMPADACEAYLVKLMNEKAAAYGAQKTHFVNTHGFHDENHYTTPYDMALIATHIRDYPELSEIVAEKSHVIQAADETGLVRHEYELYSHNEILINPELSFPEADGIKTGYTPEAGYTLLASAGNGKERMVVSIFKAESGAARALDAKTLLTGGLKNARTDTIPPAGEAVMRMPIVNARSGDDPNMELLPATPVIFAGTEAERAAVNANITYDETLLTKTEDGWEIRSDIAAGTVAGHVRYELAGLIVGETDLVTRTDIRKGSFFHNLKYRMYEQHPVAGWSLTAFVGLVILLLIRFRIKHGRRR